MIALNLAVVIQNLPRTQKMFNLLGFTHVFDMGISLFLWYLLWHCLCTPKFYPKYFYPKYSKFFFSLSTPVGLKSGIFYVGDRDYIYTYAYIYIYIYIYVSIHVYTYNIYIYINKYMHIHTYYMELYVLYIYIYIYIYNYDHGYLPRIMGFKHLELRRKEWSSTLIYIIVATLWLFNIGMEHVPFIDDSWFLPI